MFDILSLVHKNLGSFLFGALVRIKRPKCLVSFIKRKFVKMYGIDMSEASYDIDSYLSLEDLFIRKLKEGVRVIEEGALVSPCDGYISQMGKIKNKTLTQVKGKDYSVVALLKGYSYDGNQSVYDRLDQYVTIYLSPSNYHRVHSPVTGKVRGIYSVVGKLWPVNDKYVNKIVNLFSENERMIFELEVLGKYRVFVVMVGALNVGRIEESVSGSCLRTNDILKRKDQSLIFESPRDIKVGEELGVFMLGSTVVTLFESGMLEDSGLKDICGSKIKYGMSLSCK